MDIFWGLCHSLFNAKNIIPTNEKAFWLSIFAPFQQFRHGFAAYLLGLRWLRAHKVYWALLLLPMILGFAIVGSGWSLFWAQQDFIFDLVLFSQPDSWWGMIFWWSRSLLSGSAMVCCLCGVLNWIFFSFLNWYWCWKRCTKLLLFVLLDYRGFIWVCRAFIVI